MATVERAGENKVVEKWETSCIAGGNCLGLGALEISLAVS